MESVKTGIRDMVQPRSMLIVADNAGAKIIQCIRVLGGSRRRYGRVGDIIVGAVKKAEPGKLVKEHEVVRAVVVRTRAPIRRQDGSYIRFDDNAVVVIEKNEPKGGRIFGPIPRELKEKGFDKIVSMAQELV